MKEFFSPQPFPQIWNQILTCDVSLPLHPPFGHSYSKRKKPDFKAHETESPVCFDIECTRRQKSPRFKCSMLFREQEETGGGWQFREEGEREQRAADTAKSNWMKQAILLITSLNVQSGFLGANQLVEALFFCFFFLHTLLSFPE